MPSITYHAAVAFRPDTQTGELHVAEALEAPTPFSAVVRAHAFAREASGAVAFSRDADVDRGEYADPVIHLAIGELPQDVQAHLTPKQ